MSSEISSGAPIRGPFYTRRQAAQRAGLAAAALAGHPGALRISGPFGREEAYPAFQFGVPGGFVEHLPEVVEVLAARFDGGDVAAWLLLPHPDLGSLSVVDWLKAGRDPRPVLAIAHALGATSRSATAS